jgi:hypothetical protein
MRSVSSERVGWVPSTHTLDCRGIALVEYLVLVGAVVVPVGIGWSFLQVASATQFMNACFDIMTGPL